MASTAAERKAKERQLKKEQGLVLKSIWFKPEVMRIIEDFKEKHNCTDEDAINELIKPSK